LVTLWAWEILLPDIGPLPQISHRCAIVEFLLEVPTWGLNCLTHVTLFCKYERRSEPRIIVFEAAEAAIQT
jgi:hypothetical protein